MSIVTTLLNQFFITNPKLQRFCQQHCGKSVAFRYHHFNTQFYIHESGFIACAKPHTDTSISVNFEALLGYLNIKHDDAKISISGDSSLGQSFSQILLQSSLLHQSLLYHYLPSTTAMLIAQMSQYHHKLSLRILSILKSQLHHYLVYEAGLCADKNACDEQYQSILNLKHMVDRLKVT